MKISFRQGLVRYQTDINGQPTFLQKSTLNSQYIDLVVSPDPTVITFTHKNSDYVFEEAKTVTRAWGPFTGSATRYLFWDINILTGELSRGHTALPPIISGAAPSSPAVDQHWFDTIGTCMKVWNGGKWVEKIRVFAAVYSSSAIIRPSGTGTQVGLNTQINAGNIVLDGFNKPLRQSDGSFITTTTGMSVVGIATKKIKVEAEILTLLAKENIARFDCVQTRAGRTCVLARSNDRMSRVAGVATEDMYEGEPGSIVSQGLIRSDTWSWPAASVNRPLFCGVNGELTLTPPAAGVLQQVGSVYDTDAVYVNIFPSITLDHPDGVALPPAPPPSGAPVPVIAAVPPVLTGMAPHTVNFVNATPITYAPFTSIEWDFTNDGTVDSTLPNPTYTFAAPGTYNVRLRVTNAFGAGQTVQSNYITVTAAPPPAAFTNLEVRLFVDNKIDTIPAKVKNGATFGVKVQVKNDGLLTATNVQRVFIVYDVGTQQVPVVSPPAGATITRGSNYTQIMFSQIPAMASNAVVDYPPFVLRAPNSGTQLRIEAAVSSPEIDSTLSDNTRALVIELKP